MDPLPIGIGQADLPALVIMIQNDRITLMLLGQAPGGVVGPRQRGIGIDGGDEAAGFVIVEAGFATVLGDDARRPPRIITFDIQRRPIRTGKLRQMPGRIVAIGFTLAIGETRRRDPVVRIIVEARDTAAAILDGGEAMAVIAEALDPPQPITARGNQVAIRIVQRRTALKMVERVRRAAVGKIQLLGSAKPIVLGLKAWLPIACDVLDPALCVVADRQSRSGGRAEFGELAVFAITHGPSTPQRARHAIDQTVLRQRKAHGTIVRGTDQHGGLIRHHPCPASGKGRCQTRANTVAA